MSKSVLYSEILVRYQNEGVARRMSIQGFYRREGGDYRNFIGWYRKGKEKMRETEAEELTITPLMVTDRVLVPVGGDRFHSPCEGSSSDS